MANNILKIDQGKNSFIQELKGTLMQVWKTPYTF